MLFIAISLEFRTAVCVCIEDAHHTAHGEYMSTHSSIVACNFSFIITFSLRRSIGKDPKRARERIAEENME